MEYIGAGSFFSTKASRGNSWLRNSSFGRLDDLLEKGSLTTTEEILSNDEVVQELRAGSTKLVDRLCEKSSLQSIVKILTQLPPGGSSDTRKYLLPYVCVELISCENDVFLDAWVHEDATTGWSALKELLQAYVLASECEEPLNCVISGYMSRAVSNIFEKRPVEVANITKSMEASLKTAFLALLYDLSTCELLYTMLLTTDEAAVPFDRLDASEFVDVICSEAVANTEEASRNCAELLQKLLCYQCPSEDAKPVYIERLAKGLVEQTDRLVCRIVMGQEITSVMGAAANVVTGLLFNLKESGGDVVEDGCANGCDGGDDDFCCYVASTPSGSGVPTVVDSAMSSAASRRVAECVYAKIDELRMIVEGKGAEEDVELLTEVICLVTTAMTACSNEVAASDGEGQLDKLVDQEFMVAALDATIARHPRCSLLANAVLELSRALGQLGGKGVIADALVCEKEAVEKCLAGEGGRSMGCRPQIAEIVLSLEDNDKEVSRLAVESPAAEAYLSRWRLSRGMKLDLGGTIAVPRSVEEGGDDTCRSGVSLPSTSSSLLPIAASTTPSTGAMLGDDSLDSPEFFQAGSHHDTSRSPTGRAPTPEWPGPVPSDWMDSEGTPGGWPVVEGQGGNNNNSSSGVGGLVEWPSGQDEDGGWVTSPTVSDTKWVGASTPVGWPDEGDAQLGSRDEDSGEGRSMNESIDLVEADVSEGSSVSDNGSEN